MDLERIACLDPLTAPNKSFWFTQLKMDPVLGKIAGNTWHHVKNGTTPSSNRS